MNEPGNDFFAGAALTLNQDRNVRAGYLLNLEADWAHGVGRAKDDVPWGSVWSSARRKAVDDAVNCHSCPSPWNYSACHPATRQACHSAICSYTSTLPAKDRPPARIGQRSPLQRRSAAKHHV